MLIVVDRAVLSTVSVVKRFLYQRLLLEDWCFLDFVLGDIFYSSNWVLSSARGYLLGFCVLYLEGAGFGCHQSQFHYLR